MRNGGRKDGGGGGGGVRKESMEAVVPAGYIGRSGRYAESGTSECDCTKILCIVTVSAVPLLLVDERNEAGPFRSATHNAGSVRETESGFKLACD